jgi:hypothetical protein
MSTSPSAEQGTKQSSRAHRAALVASIGFSALVLLQLALAMGAPVGRVAWGGRADVLPPVLRQASAIAALYLTLAIYVVLVRVGVWSSPLPKWIFRIATWILAVQMSINTLANLATRNPWEQWLMTPIAATLAVCCFLVARAPARDA